MIKSIRILSLPALLLVLPSTVLSEDENKKCVVEEAEVVMLITGCDYFIIDGNFGFHLLKRRDGYMPSKGDPIIIGDILSSTETKNVYYWWQQMEGHVSVRGHPLSKDDASKMLRDHCH